MPHDAAGSELSALLRGVLLGTLDRAQVEAAVEAHWPAGHFVHHLPAAELPAWPAAARHAHRYGFNEELATDEQYGTPGAPGCLRIFTPEGGPWDRSLQRLRVPFHTHDSAHITVVTSGCPTFLAVREVAGARTVVAARMRPGSMVLYAAGVPHTFAADEAFEVASLQAAYKAPERPDFAPGVAEAMDSLPQVTYEAFLESLAPAPAPC